jgi:hypothetical protein
MRLPRQRVRRTAKGGVDRMRLDVASVARLLLRLETLKLLARLVQLRISVAVLLCVDKQLKALSHVRLHKTE